MAAAILYLPAMVKWSKRRVTYPHHQGIALSHAVNISCIVTVNHACEIYGYKLLWIQGYKVNFCYNRMGNQLVNFSTCKVILLI